MIKTLVTTKDRPLQLTACLESLFEYMPVQQKDVYIIGSGRDQYGEEIIGQFSDCHWWWEDENYSFEFLVNAFAHEEAHDNILFVTDDVIWTRYVSLSDINAFEVSRDLLFSLSFRLGEHINCFPSQHMEITCDNEKLLFWDYNLAKHHFSYPFSVTADIHRSSVIRDILGHAYSKGRSIKTPNFLEEAGVKYCWENKDRLPRFNSCFSKASAIACDLNRVQSDFPNPVGGSEDESSWNLIKQYRLGRRIDWWRMFKTEEKEPFCGNKHFRLTEKEQYGQRRPD